MISCHLFSCCGIQYQMFWKILRLLRCGLKEFGILVFGTTFSNISAISWRPVWWWRKLERATDPGQATGKLYYLRLRVECTHFLGANPRRIGDRLVWLIAPSVFQHLIIRAVWLIAPSVFQHLIIRAEFWHPFSFLSHVPRCELEFYNFMFFGYMWVYFYLEYIYVSYSGSHFDTWVRTDVVSLSVLPNWVFSPHNLTSTECEETSVTEDMGITIILTESYALVFVLFKLLLLHRSTS